MTDIDDILDKLTFHLQNQHSEEYTTDPIPTNREEYIQRKLQETLCICSIFFGIEYDLQYNKND